MQVRPIWSDLPFFRPPLPSYFLSFQRATLAAFVLLAITYADSIRRKEGDKKMKTIDPVLIGTETETIARETADKAESKAEFCLYSVAAACYGSVSNYVELIELQMISSQFEVIYSNEGYAIQKRATRVEMKFQR